MLEIVRKLRKLAGRGLRKINIEPEIIKLFIKYGLSVFIRGKHARTSKRKQIRKRLRIVLSDGRELSDGQLNADMLNANGRLIHRQLQDLVQPEYSPERRSG